MSASFVSIQEFYITD